MIDVVVEHSWDENPGLKDFILNDSDNGTLFHRPLFLQYHSRDKFQHTEPIKILFYKKAKLVACITGAVQHNNGEKEFFSPFASSYGGLIFHSDLSFKEIEDVYIELLNHLEKEYSHIKLSSTPSFQSQTGKSRYIDHILLNKGFSITKSDIILVHHVGPDDDLPTRIDKKTFTELKQPLFKNKLRLEIINGVDLESYNQLLKAQERLQSTPTHTFDELLRIESLLPGTVQTFKAYSADNFVAGIITFRLNKNILSTFYVFDTPEGRNLKANHFTYYNVAKNAFENNYKYVDFGASSFGWLPNYPLISFKEKFDSKPFLRHIFEKQK
jgi:Acetyltransferase (GNAT) domain